MFGLVYVSASGPGDYFEAYLLQPFPFFKILGSVELSPCLNRVDFVLVFLNKMESE